MINNSQGNKLRNLDFLSKKFFNFERKNVYLNKNEQNELNKIPFLSRFQNKFNLSDKKFLSSKQKLYKTNKKFNSKFTKTNTKIDKLVVNSNILIDDEEESKLLGLNLDLF